VAGLLDGSVSLESVHAAVQRSGIDAALDPDPRTVMAGRAITASRTCWRREPPEDQVASAVIADDWVCPVERHTARFDARRAPRLFAMFVCPARTILGACDRVEIDPEAFSDGLELESAATRRPSWRRSDAWPADAVTSCSACGLYPGLGTRRSIVRLALCEIWGVCLWRDTDLPLASGPVGGRRHRLPPPALGV
jgi:hypothetical protein